MSPRLRYALIAAGALVLAAVFAGVGSSATTLECDRTPGGGACLYARSSLWRNAAATFELAAVREVRFLDGLGKHRGDAETVLVFATGNDLHLARADRDAARAHFDTFHAFFTPGAKAPPKLRYATSGSPAFYLLTLVGVVVAVGCIVRAVRAKASAPRVVAPAADPQTRKVRRRAVMFLGGLVLLGLIAQAVLMLHASQTQGTLELTCKQRCRFQGMECLPGGSVQMALDPGRYTIEIWAATGSALWQPRELSITLGETTRFICE